MTFDRDVEFYAAYLANKQGRSVTDEDREDVRELLNELLRNGRLLPEGGVTVVEYGLHDTRMTRRDFPVYIGTTAWAENRATHLRHRTVWPSDEPNDRWAKYVTAWEVCPWRVVGATKREWDQKVAEAVSTGLASCHYCGFEQYKNHKLCVKCGVPDWDYLS